jgi:hypothetical protein
LSDAESAKKPSSKKLKQFIDKGGYALLERAGMGTTTEERQKDAWEQFGIINELAEKTGLAKPTLYLIRDWYSTQNEAGFEMLWIAKEKLDKLNDARGKMRDAQAKLKRINEIIERSIIVDSVTVRMQQEICGFSPEEALKNALKGAATHNPLEEQTKDLMAYLREVESLINDAQFGAKAFQR